MRLVHLMALVVVASAADDSAGTSRFSLLRVLQKSLQGTSNVVRGVGDAAAISIGGTIRIIGGTMQQVGGGLEGLSDAVAGEQADSKDDNDLEGSTSVSDALRAVASRPFTVVGRALRSIGDTTNFLGDTTERIAADTFAILPDSVRVVETSVRSLRDKIGDTDSDEYYLDEVTAARDGATAPMATPTGLKLRRLEEGEKYSTPSSAATTHAEGAAAAAAAAAASSAPTGSSALRGSAWLRRRAGSERARSPRSATARSWLRSGAADVGSLRPHALLALGAVAVSARSGASWVGIGLMVLLSLHVARDSSRTALAAAEAPATHLHH